jgi:hypothetical protein
MFGSIVDMLTWMAAYLRIVIKLGHFRIYAGLQGQAIELYRR